MLKISLENALYWQLFVFPKSLIPALLITSYKYLSALEPKCTEIVFTPFLPLPFLDIRPARVYNKPVILEERQGFGMKQASVSASRSLHAAACGMCSFFAFNSAARFTDGLRFFFYYAFPPRL